MKKKLIVASILGIAGTAGVMETNVFAQNISSDEEIEEAWENQNEELSTTNPYITERENPPIIEKTDLVTADENKSEVKEDSFESGFKEIISDDEVFYDNKITDKDGFMDFSLDQTVISTDKTSEDKLESLPITESKIEGNNAVEIENSTSVEEDSFNVSDISKLVKTAKYVSNIQNGWNANQTSYYIDGKLTYGQKQIDGHWYYFDHNGNKAVNSFINLTAQENKEGAKTVYYNGKGQMLYGQQKLNNNWYCFNLFDGRMLTGLTYLSKGYEPSGAKTVYYDPSSGKMQYGEVKVNGNWMYFDTVTGAQAKNKQITVKNSVSNNGKTSTYYYKGDGKKATGEMQIQSKWKCFDIKTGAMKTGFVKLTKKDYKTNRDKTVYYDGNGNMVYGQKKIGNDWYCFDLGDGKMFTGLTYLSQKYERNGAKTVYYDPASGKMWYGQVKVNGNWKCFDLVTGAMKTGFVKLTKKDYKTNRDKTVYYDGNGNMVYGQKKIGNDWYCFDLGDGKMFTGLTYLSQKYEKNGAKTVYYDPSNGKMRYGLTDISGKKYYFNLISGEMIKNSVVKEGNTYYTVDKNGIATKTSQIKNILSGLDISNWQKDIDLNKIEADFIILKASGGKGYSDPCFLSFAQQTLKSGRLLGFYHFARDLGYKGNAVEEAQFFYQTVKDYIGLGVPILDWETDLDLGPDWAYEFLNTFYNLSGVKPLIYTSASVTRDYDWTKVANNGYKLWLAQYANMNKVDGHQLDVWRDPYGNGAFGEPIMHQYTSMGNLNGYRGNLDLNIFYGNYLDWKSLC